MRGGGGGDELRNARSRYTIASKSKRKFAAYMYSRCDRPERERFYAILSAVARRELGLDVDALGACGGEGGLEIRERRSNRFTHSWHDDAVEVYRDYQFVIAFENIVAPMYVTEKITNAMLAGAIPIYWGTNDIKKIFNENSFIHCKTDRLEECAEDVVRLYQDKERLREVIGESWGVSEETLRTEFGFMDYGDARVVRELRNALVRDRFT